MSVMTGEQESDVNDALSKLRAVIRALEALFDDEDVSAADVDFDLSEAIDKCNSAIESMYDAKKEKA